MFLVSYFYSTWLIHDVYIYIWSQWIFPKQNIWERVVQSWWVLFFACIFYADSKNTKLRKCGVLLQQPATVFMWINQSKWLFVMTRNSVAAFLKLEAEDLLTFPSCLLNLDGCRSFNEQIS